jgi:bacteriocin-like protein
MTSINTVTKGEVFCQLTASEMASVSGGSTMDIIAQAWINVTKNCLYRLTREGTVIDCSPGWKRPG